MNQKLILYLSAFLILTSCAGKLGITKRRYTKGFYVSHTKDRQPTKATEQQKHAPANVNSVAKHEVFLEKSTEILNAPVTGDKLTAINERPGQNQMTAQKETVVASASAGNINGKTSVFKPLTIKTLHNKQLDMKASDSDIKFIVMVVLCFFVFINLIPVYLHDGKTITLNFWITLLLDLTIIGGIIFSLLVVLDIINLK